MYYSWKNQSKLIDLPLFKNVKKYIITYIFYRKK